jgi:hypothetical protein
MKNSSKAACLIALFTAAYYLYSIFVATASNPTFVHVETVASPFHGTLRGIPCVESHGSVECFAAVSK